MKKDKDVEYDEAKVDETEVLNRPEDVGGGSEPEPEGEAPKVRVRTKEKAQKDILNAVAKACEAGTVDAELSDEAAAGVVVPVLDALYEAYEEDGTVPTREAFAERCGDDGLAGEVAGVVLAMERDPFAARRIGGKAVAAICAGFVLVLAVVCGGALALSTGGDEVPAETPSLTVTSEDADEEETYVLSVGASAEGWDAETSSPVIVHVVSEELGVDYYHAYDANVACQLPAEAGEYQLSFVAPVNADGSTYRVPETQTVQAVVSDDGQGADLDLPYEFELVGAEDVAADELTAVIEQVTAAIRGGDETLTGVAGAAVADRVKENCAANPNADSEAVEEAGAEAEEASQAESTAQTGQVGGSGASEDSSSGGATSSTGGSAPSSSGGSGSSSGSGNSGSSSSGGSGSTSGGSSSSGGSSQSQHTHNWVAQTTTVHHDAVYKTVHHDAVYTTVHHDAVTESRSICNSCGADITGSESAHMKEYALKGDMTHSYSVKPVVVQDAYDEQVLVTAAYDEQVLVTAAYDETVTTGYKCSGCGATK